MAHDLGKCAKIFIGIFAIFNVLFTVIGIVVLAVGIYLVVESQTYDFITGNDYISGAALLIVSGIITIIIAGVGFVGAVLKWRPLLAIYAIVLTIIIILEIIGGAVGFYFRDSIAEQSAEEYRNAWRRAIEDYRVNSTQDANTAVDTFQNNFECCGIDNATDWGRFNPQYLIDNNNNLPDSCQCSDDDSGCRSITFTYGNQSSFTGFAWREGCFQSTVDVSVFIAAVSGGIGIAFGIIEVVGIVIAIALICCITAARKQEVV